MNGPIPSHWMPYLQGLLRIVVALLFITHGTQKLFNVPVGPMGPVSLASKYGVAQCRMVGEASGGVEHARDGK